MIAMGIVKTPKSGDPDLCGATEPTDEQKKGWEADTFHLREYDANVSLWGRKSYWTVDEATALLFAKAPEEVQLRWVEDYEGQYDFADEYLRVHELIEEAVNASVLPNPIPPRLLLSWADHHSVLIPDAVRSAIIAREAEISELLAERDKLIESQQKLRRELEEARYAADCLRGAQAEPQNTEPEAARDLSERERQSLYKLIIGMAIRGYGHNPFDASKATKKSKEIASDVALLGMSIDEDTVRKYLTEAKELVSSEEAQRLAQPNSVKAKPNSAKR